MPSPKDGVDENSKNDIVVYTTEEKSTPQCKNVYIQGRGHLPLGHWDKQTI